MLPGYAALEAMLTNIQARGVLGNPVVLQHVLAALLTVATILLIAWRARRSLNQAGVGAIVPGPEVSTRNLVEALAEALYAQMRQIIGKDAKRYFPVLFTLTLFILFGNLLGLVPGFKPPTDNWNTTFACGLIVFVYYNYHGLRTQGLQHIAHMANPTGVWWGWFMAPLMFPIELVSHIARPLSLGVRLAANMVGDHAVLLAFVGLMPYFLPMPFMLLGLVVCIVQTLVFMLLSMVYLGMATADAHGDHDTHAPGATVH